MVDAVALTIYDETEDIVSILHFIVGDRITYLVPLLELRKQPKKLVAGIKAETICVDDTTIGIILKGVYYPLEQV